MENYHHHHKKQQQQQQPDLLSFKPLADQEYPTVSSEPSLSSSSFSSTSPKTAPQSRLQCYKNILKRKFSSNRDKGGDISPSTSPPFSFSPNRPFGSPEFKATRSESTVAAAGVIAAALCDSSDASTKTFRKPNQSGLVRNKKCLTDCSAEFSKYKFNPTNPNQSKSQLPQQNSKLSTLFDTFIQDNLLYGSDSTLDSAADSTTNSTHSEPEKPCQFTGLVNKIMTNVFTGIPEPNSSNYSSHFEPLQPNQQIKPSSASSTSAICQLLEFDNSCQNQSTASFKAIPTSTMTPQISDKVYHQLIEFEFNYESLQRKFSIKSDDPDISMSRSTLNYLESAHISELVKVLSPLQFCLSSQSTQAAEAKRDLYRSISGEPTVTMDFQRQTLFTITERSCNLLIGLAKQIKSFSILSSSDQMSLLKNSVMEIMLLRSIMIRPQKGQDEASEGSYTNYCTSHSNELDSPEIVDSQMIRNDVQQQLDESSIRGILDSGKETEEEREQQMAAHYAKMFKDFYGKLAETIDVEWKEDRTIFYLLFAILLFRPANVGIIELEKVREEQVTYVYLLKRHLEHKFRSYCTARSHFIRIFDRLEELHHMDEQVIQKLLPLELVNAQNLIEKLCIC